MPTKIAKLENFVAGRAGATKLVKAWRQQWQSGLPKPSPTKKVAETRKVRMLRVTAVFFSDDDGSRATGKKFGGKIVPVDGLLRNPSIHTKAGENYIDDWISLANKQLWVSGADFLLDRKNVRYVLEPNNTEVNSFFCDASAQPALDLVAKKQKAKGDNPWKDSLLLLFPWGPGEADDANKQGCSNAEWPFIKMAQYLDLDANPRLVDGLPVLGNNLLTHELGHFLGLGHTFPGELHTILDNMTMDTALNPKGLALTAANLPEFVGLVAADIEAIRENGKKFIATWLHDIDPDGTPADVPDGFPLSVMVKDTPTNLGMALPAMMGDTIGSGDQEYELKRFAKMTPNADNLFGTPKGDGDPFIENVPLNQVVRLNVMGYWYANVYGQKFSKHQVERMEFAVSSVRANLIDRVVNVTVTVNKDSIDVTESAFFLPKIVEKPPEEFEFQMPEFGRREIERALARVRKPTPALARLLRPGNSCSVRSRR